MLNITHTGPGPKYLDLIIKPRSFFVGLPDYSSRCAILQTMLRNVPLDIRFDIERIARESEGYSGSDLKELLRTAALFPLREARMAFMQQQQQQQQIGKATGGKGGMPPLRSLTTEDVLRAKERVAPTQFSPGYRAALAEYANRANAGNGGAGAGVGSNDYNNPYMDGGLSDLDFFGNQPHSHNARPNNMYDKYFSNDLENEHLDFDFSDDEDSSSSSLTDDDDLF